MDQQRQFHQHRQPLADQPGPIGQTLGEFNRAPDDLGDQPDAQDDVVRPPQGLLQPLVQAIGQARDQADHSVFPRLYGEASGSVVQINGGSPYPPPIFTSHSAASMMARRFRR
jgi:hypothetical protein